MANKRIIMANDIKNILIQPNFFSEPVDLRGRKYHPLEPKSSKGYKSVVWKGVDEYSTPVAIKFATYEDYMDRPYLEEVSRAARLREFKQFAFFYDAEIVELKLSEDKKIKCVCFIEEYIKGYSLEDYIDKCEITSTFIFNYIREMCEILNTLKELNLRHDDLHLGNIRVAFPKKEALSEEYTVRIIDMGSLKPYDSPLTKSKDDLGRFTEHLVALYNSMLLNYNQHRRPLSIKDRKFRNEVIPLLNSMLEDDKQIALIEPSKILSQFEHAYIKAQSPEKNIELKLEDPFDYISAEHIASDKLLVQLFAESCPWAKEVSSPNPILLTGPRGCGKSMLFRRLSLKALLYKSPEDIKSSKIAGFYISCSANFRNRFGWITSEITAKKFKNEIIHYFNLLLLYEIIQTLIYINQRNDNESLFGFGKIHEKEIYEFLIDKLNIKEERRLRLQGVTPLEHLLEIIEYEMNYCYDKFLKGLNLESTTSISFISDLTRFINNKVEYFNAKTITFLLDDFSIHRISEQVQYILNPIIWDRQATHIFKLSAEKYGAERIFEFYTESSPTADITREFREIDCGQFYLYLSDKDLLDDLVNFAKELLDQRLTLAGFSGNSETIIGHSEHKKSLGRVIRDNPKSRDYYHGLETIAEICSGDVSALLEIYRRIFKAGKVDKDTNSVVKKHTQHDAIESVSRSFLELIKTFHPYGKEMYNIVLNFGTLSRKILVGGKEMYFKKDDGTLRNVPNETTRIEVDQIHGEGEDWTNEQEKLMRELVRRAMFIEMEPGRGRQSLGPTWRWQLRRIYCPSFGTGLKKTTAIKWETRDLKYFLINPKEKCDDEFEKWKSPTRIPHEGQRDLDTFGGVDK